MAADSSIDVDSLASLVHASGCHALRRVAQALTQLYDQHFEELGLRSTEFAALRVCAACGPLSLRGFSRELDATPRMVQRTIRPLLARELLHAVSSPDNRPQEYALTPAGKRALSEGIQQWNLAQSRLIDALGEDGWQRVKAQLSLLCDVTP